MKLSTLLKNRRSFLLPASVLWLGGFLVGGCGGAGGGPKTPATAKPLIAFQSNRETQSRITRIYRMDTDGSNVAPLTPIGTSGPVLSGDGHFLGYAELNNAFAKDLQTGAIRALSDHPNGAPVGTSPSNFDQTGRLVSIIQANERGDVCDVIERATGRIVKSVPDSGLLSRDGRFLANRASYMEPGPNIHFFLYSLDSNAMRALNLPQTAYFTDFSPDGRTLLLTIYSPGISSLAFYDLETEQITTINAGPVSNASGRFSPDGRQIVFVSNRDGNDEIYVMNLDGSNQRNLSNNPADDNSPTWGG